MWQGMSDGMPKKGVLVPSFLDSGHVKEDAREGVLVPSFWIESMSKRMPGKDCWFPLFWTVGSRGKLSAREVSCRRKKGLMTIRLPKRY
jgi:hypothetical protein